MFSVRNTATILALVGMMAISGMNGAMNVIADGKFLSSDFGTRSSTDRKLTAREFAALGNKMIADS